ncbi:rCG36034, partial [Rattus norvegicus]
SAPSLEPKAQVIGEVLPPKSRLYSLPCLCNLQDSAQKLQLPGI